MSEVLGADEFEAIVGTGLSTDDGDIIDVVITREEDALALVIGALTGERTETIYPTRDAPVILSRFTDEVEVEDDGTATTVRLLPDRTGRAGGVVAREDGGAWTGPVEITYTPTDEERVKRYLIEATRAALLPDRERVVAEDRAGAAMHRENAAAERARLLRDLRPAAPWDAVRVRSSVG